MVFVLDKHKKPLMPCSEKRARLLLERGRARVHKLEPFTIRLVDRLVENSVLQPLRLKLDPGSGTTGVAVLREETVTYIGEIKHKTYIKERIEKRRNVRRSRRNRNTRYRQPRFLNRAKTEKWIPPSLQAIVDQTMNAVKKFRMLLPISSISMELARFDTQKLQNAEISGVKYQQGELFGYEVKEYLLEKWKRECVYCGKKDLPLQIEHIVPKSRGGSDRVSNLTLSCQKCNQEKGSKTAREFGFPEVQEKAKQPLKEVAIMNATRWKLLDMLKDTGLEIECGSGGLTKFNRTRLGLPKTHGYDAVSVGSSTPEKVKIATAYLSIWKCLGRGVRRMCTTNKFGFSISHRGREKIYFGFQTGDLVKAVVPKGKYIGEHKGVATIRRSGSFDIKNSQGTIECSYKFMKVLQRKSGWQFEKIAI